MMSLFCLIQLPALDVPTTLQHLPLVEFFLVVLILLHFIHQRSFLVPHVILKTVAH